MLRLKTEEIGTHENLPYEAVQQDHGQNCGAYINHAATLNQSRIQRWYASIIDENRSRGKLHVR